MTDRLEHAFAEASKLPPDQQDQLAEWLLDELADDERWAQRFTETADTLARLAREAQDEHRDGATQDIDVSLR